MNRYRNQLDEKHCLDTTIPLTSIIVASLPVSLIIPVYNEHDTIEELVMSINNQTLPPQEIIIVDGGSTDKTAERLIELTKSDSRYKIVRTDRAMPGQGRNTGTEIACNSWIAYTDAGIRLDRRWLEELAMKAEAEPKASIIYGNYSPVIENFFEKCASISYVPAAKPGKIRGKFIASSLMKREVWSRVGGFPDWRATEDLVFMEKSELLGYQEANAPAATVSWKLRPGLRSTFRKFVLYSRNNVWAGRQAYWHYGVARQYMVIPLSFLLATFHRWYWILLIPLWFGGRVAKRVWNYRYEFGKGILFNPAVYLNVAVITVVIDMATFVGWIQALFNKQEYRKFSTS